MGQRQLAALGFVIFLLLGCVSTIAYLAGRVAGPKPDVASAKSMAPSKASNDTAALRPALAAKPAARSSVEQLIVVEPVSSPRVAAAAAVPVAPPPAPTKPPEIKPVASELLVGNTFWQVAATDRGMSEVTLELLTRKGMPTLLGDGPSPGIFRVLVGPLRTADETNRHKALLDEAGFHPFIKKY